VKHEVNKIEKEKNRELAPKRSSTFSILVSKILSFTMCLGPGGFARAVLWKAFVPVCLVCDGGSTESEATLGPTRTGTYRVTIISLMVIGR
jgi:hypothetical protein